MPSPVWEQKLDTVRAITFQLRWWPRGSSGKEAETHIGQKHHILQTRFLHDTHISAQLTSTGTEFLCFGLSFQGSLYRKQPLRIKLFLQSKGQACLLSIVKDLHFPSSGLLYCHANHGRYRYLLDLFAARPCGNWGSGNCHKRILILCLLLFLWLIKSFFSDPWVLCLLPVSTEL